MNWDAIAAIAELLGSLAVLATLIYLSLQVRQSKQILEENRKLALSQVFQARSDTKHAMHLQGTTEFLATALAKVRELEPGKHDEVEKVLTPAELNCLRSWQAAWATHTDNVAYQSELGLMDEETIEIAATAYAQTLPFADRILDGSITPRVKRFVEKHGKSGA
jgi:hypothetical protein